MTTADAARAAATKTERYLFSGIGLRFLGEAVILPTGLITAAFLSRRFGPEGYGLIALTVAIISWIEWGINSAFARGAIKYVAESRDWEPAAGKIVQWHLLLSLMAVAAVWVGAVPMAQTLQQEELAPMLRLLALDIPFFCAGNAHYNILVARQLFRPCAFLSSVRAMARLILIVCLVLGDLGLPGVLWGLIGSSFFTLLGCRLFVHPPILKPLRVQMPGFWNAAGWLFGYALLMRLFERMDLLVLKSLGQGTEEAGYYGAAQNLCHILNLLAISTSPLLLATLTRAFKEQNRALIKSIATKGLRFLLLLAPLVCLASILSEKITLFVYGPSFKPAAGVMAILIFGSFGMMIFSIGTAALTAADRGRQTFFLAAGMIPAALACQLAFIPHWGMTGAAAATTLVAAAGAAASLFFSIKLIFSQRESPVFVKEPIS